MNKVTVKGEPVVAPPEVGKGIKCTTKTAAVELNESEGMRLSTCKGSKVTG